MTDAQIATASIDELRTALRECRAKRDADIERQEMLVHANRDLITTQEKLQIDIATVIDETVLFLRGPNVAEEAAAVAATLDGIAKELRLRAEDRLGIPRVS